MCWTTDVIPKLEVAKEDIPVKKVLLNYYGSLYSPVLLFFKWEFNVIKVTKLGESDYHFLSKTFSIGYGFHSCEDIHRNNGYFANNWTNKCFNTLFVADSREEVFNAIIPKGSKYYKNEEGDYVSDKLMIIGE